MSYSKFKFFFSSDEEGTFWPGVVELPVDNEVSSVEPGNDENKNQRIITGVISVSYTHLTLPTNREV